VPEKLKHHSVERPPPTLATLTKNVANTFAGKRIRCKRNLDWNGWTRPGESVTQEKFNGRGEDRLAKSGGCTAHGLNTGEKIANFDTVLEKAQISPLQKAPPKLERSASALEKELASLFFHEIHSCKTFVARFLFRKRENKGIPGSVEQLR
jgi:hypothetical protein